MTWRDLAACKDLPQEELDYFFGDREDMGTHQQHERARLHCYSCPVQVQCLRWATEKDVSCGVWGGLTESQRKRYLAPAVRKEGTSDEVLGGVVLQCGARIFKRLKIQGEMIPLPRLQ